MNYLDYIKQFGIKIFILKMIRHILYKNNTRVAWQVNKQNENLILNYLDKQFSNSDYILKKEYRFINESVPHQPIFVMWWQGEANAPEIVKMCIRSIRKNCGNHSVILISEDNFEEYIKLPDFIIEKFKMGCISRTHLSDIIRLYLLSVYGGAWIDATVYVSNKIKEVYFDKDLYTINFGRYTKDPSHGRWTTFLLFTKKNNPLIEKTLEYHYMFWLKHNMIIDYILFDYIIQYVVMKDADCMEQVTSLSKDNCGVFEMRNKLNLIYSDHELTNVLKGSVFHKLSWKEQFIYSINGKDTIYNALLKS